MTFREAKAFVRSRVPTAEQEHHVTYGGERYYLVRARGEHLYLGSGDTPAQAWKSAAEALERVASK